MQSTHEAVGLGRVVSVQAEHPVWAHCGCALEEMVVVLAVAETEQPETVEVEVLHVWVVVELITVGEQVTK